MPKVAALARLTASRAGAWRREPMKYAIAGAVIVVALIVAAGVLLAGLVCGGQPEIEED